MMITLVVTCALFMEILDGTVIATALPQMARTFHENPVNLGIGISAYLITLAVHAGRHSGARIFERTRNPERRFDN